MLNLNNQGYYSEDSFYVAPLTLYVATMDISKNPPQMSLKTQPFFDYFTVFPFALDNVEVSSDGLSLYMLAFSVGGYLNTNFTQFLPRSKGELLADQRRAISTLRNHGERLMGDYKRNLGLQSRREKQQDKKSQYTPSFENIQDMKRSMRNEMKDLDILVEQSLITINLATLTVTDVQTFDPDSLCFGLTLKKNRCHSTSKPSRSVFFLTC